MAPRPVADPARTDLLSAVALVLIAGATLLIGASKPWLSYPVTATFTRLIGPPSPVVAELTLAEASVAVAEVHLPGALAVVLLFLAAVRATWLIPVLRRRREAALDRDHHGMRWLEYSQVAGILSFLVAQLNGITEVTSLVPCYALGAAAGLLLVLHDRRERTGRAGLLAFSFGTMIGIVPWGLIAVAQLGGTAAGIGVDVATRVTTVATLLALVAVWVVVWLRGRGQRTPEGARRLDGMLALTIPLAVLVVVAFVVIG